MDFDYEASGGMTFRGCADPIVVEEHFTHKFGVGALAYRADRARKGFLESISIKRVKRIDPVKIFDETGCIVLQKFLYIDTFNAIYNEEDLMWPDEAKAAAIDYWQDVADESLALLKEQGCA